MNQLPTTRRSPIGLDIGSRYLKAAQCRGDRLEAALSMQRLKPGEPFDADEATRLYDVLERRGFKGRAIVTTAPKARVLTSVLDMPPASSGAPVAELARVEMARSHRFDAHTLEVAHWPLPGSARSEKGGPVMAAACQHEPADEIIDVLEAAGFEVRGLDIDGWALTRLAQGLLDELGPMLAVVDLGYHATSFLLVHHASLVYERVLGGMGLAAPIQKLQHEHNIDVDVLDYLFHHAGLSEPDDVEPGSARLAAIVRGPLETHVAALAQELRLALAYASHQYPDAPLARIGLVGGGAEVPGLAERLASELETDTAPLRPVDLLTIGPFAAQAHHATLALAAGLALYPQEALA
ncbi:MAG: pilus assembly protein PilM [Phycisphaeraceae bacterium]